TEISWFLRFDATQRRVASASTSCFRTRSSAAPYHTAARRCCQGNSRKFMSHEQAQGKPVDARADLFSLGCVMYLMLTGQPPFKGDNTMSLLASLALDRPAAPRSLAPEVPEKLNALVMDLLSKKPEWRPASARAVLAARSC